MDNSSLEFYDHLGCPRDFLIGVLPGMDLSALFETDALIYPRKFFSDFS